MADGPLSGRPAATSVVAADLVGVTVDVGTTPASKKITLLNFINSLVGLVTTKLGLAVGGTNVDLSGSGSATAFLAQAVDHVISARNILEADLAGFTDLYTADTSTTKHGLCPKVIEPSAGVQNILAVDNGETAASWKALSAVPAKTVVFFDDAEANVPSGWTNKCATWGGRFLVAMPTGGTVAGTVGTALTTQQDKTHTHTGPSHTHASNIGSSTGTDSVQQRTVTTDSTGAAGAQMGSWQDAGVDTVYNVLTGTAAGGTGATGTAATSDVAPYVQFTVMEKS